MFSIPFISFPRYSRKIRPGPCLPPWRRAGPRCRRPAVTRPSLAAGRGQYTASRQRQGLQHRTRQISPGDHLDKKWYKKIWGITITPGSGVLRILIPLEVTLSSHLKKAVAVDRNIGQA